MKECEYELRFRLQDGGERKFASRVAAEDQGNMAERLALDIAQLFSLMNWAPSPAEMLIAMGKEACPFLFDLARLNELWTGVCNFGDAFKVTVDLGIVMAEAEDNDIARARELCKRAGFTVIEPTIGGGP